MSRFRSGCHGLRVDTRTVENRVRLDWKERLCLVCNSTQHVQDEHHFLFDCAVYSSYELVMQAFFSKLAQLQTFSPGVKQMHCGAFITSCFSLRSGVLS